MIVVIELRTQQKAHYQYLSVGTSLNGIRFYNQMVVHYRSLSLLSCNN